MNHPTTDDCVEASDFPQYLYYYGSYSGLRIQKSGLLISTLKLVSPNGIIIDLYSFQCHPHEFLRKIMSDSLFLLKHLKQNIRNANKLTKLQGCLDIITFSIHPVLSKVVQWWCPARKISCVIGLAKWGYHYSSDEGMYRLENTLR